jgi:hypothetical protein
MALCPPEGAHLDDGGLYMPSLIQLKIWSWWREFWDEWVPLVCRGEKFDVVINGDSIDGVHHNSTTQISHNLEDQKRLAEVVIRPIAEKANRLFVVRGTSAHVGESGVNEEELAKTIGAVPNAEGQYARHELWIRIGTALVHCMHHIGTTGSAAYESTAVHKEMIESLTESARHNLEPPDVIVRSHRHRYFRTMFSSNKGDAISVVTPGWQAKTPFAYRIPGGRISLPQFGGIIVRSGDEEHVYVRHKTFSLDRPKVEGEICL